VSCQAFFVTSFGELSADSFQLPAHINLSESIESDRIGIIICWFNRKYDSLRLSSSKLGES